MVFEEDGVRFQYPDNWKLTREEADNGWTVSVQSPDTAFFLMAFDKSMPEVGEVADTVLEALRADYPDLEAEDALESIANQPALGHDITFFSLDLTNTCRAQLLQRSRHRAVDVASERPGIRRRGADLQGDPRVGAAGRMIHFTLNNIGVRSPGV